MGHSCCVSGQKSNYGKAPYITVFKFRKEKTLRGKWLKNIQRDNFEVNDKTVCVIYFKLKFVVREDIFPLLNSELIRVPLKIPNKPD